MEKYRTETGNVYEYDGDANAYMFIGKLNGRTLKQFISDREKLIEFELMNNPWGQDND